MIASGAYGFRLTGLDTDMWLGVHGAGHWPEVSFRSDPSPNAPELTLDLKALEVGVRADVAHSELVHPLLGRIASHVALARGADGMHAGAIAGGDGAWAVIGSKGAGKSTLLAALNDAGVPIVTDDVLVFHDGDAMAGPRCIDLRPDATRFGLGVAVRPSDPRNRIALPAIAAEHPIVGLIHLEWSTGETALEPLDHRDALRRLLVVRADKGYPRRPDALLDLATLPSVVLRRPRSMDGLGASVSLVERVLSAPRTARRSRDSVTSAA